MARRCDGAASLLLLSILITSLPPHAAERRGRTSPSTPETSQLRADGGGSELRADYKAEICAKPERIQRVASILQLAETTSGKMDISVEEIAAYFHADVKTTEAALDDLGVVDLSSASDVIVDVSALCVATLRHITDVMGWPFPMELGKKCMNWALSDSSSWTCLEWLDMTRESVEEIAQDVDLALDLGERGWEQASEAAPAVAVGGGGGGAASAADAVMVSEDLIEHEECQTDCNVAPANFDYSATELFVQIANLFDVYPSQPQALSTQGNPGSLSETGELDDPFFGPKVRPERHDIWRKTIAKSYAWVDSALQRMHSHPVLLKAWFGSNVPRVKVEVHRVLTGMKKTLSNTKIHVGRQAGFGRGICNESSPVMAYVEVTRNGHGQLLRSGMDGDRYVINVCEAYWKPEMFNSPASRYGTMVHESAHHHGPTDESYMGATPYGRAQCLRMAQEKPEKAVANADNYKWYVYYLNRCTGPYAKGLSSPTSPPCKLELEQTRDASNQTATKITAECDREVAGMTLKILSSDGSQFARKSKVYRTPAKGGRFVLDENVQVKDEEIVALFYEAGCSIWEARGTWRKQSEVVKAESRRIVEFGQGRGSGGKIFVGILIGFAVIVAGFAGWGMRAWLKQQTRF